MRFLDIKQKEKPTGFSFAVRMGLVIDYVAFIAERRKNPDPSGEWVRVP